MATTYTELRAEILAWINRAEIEQAIPTFITMAEATFNREVRHRRMMTRKTANLTTARLALPTDWLEAVNIQISGTNAGSRLEYVSPFELDRVRDRTTSGQPEVYSLVADEIEFAPTPNATYTVEMLYYAKIPALATNTTNWLLSEAPDLYLYASLVHVEPYLGNDPRIPVWKGLTETLLASLNDADERARLSGGPLIPRIANFD